MCWDTPFEKHCTRPWLWPLRYDRFLLLILNDEDRQDDNDEDNKYDYFGTEIN